MDGCHVHTSTLVGLPRSMGATFRFIIADRRERSCAECNNEVRGTLVCVAPLSCRLICMEEDRHGR
jgi:hypothetical protein